MSNTINKINVGGVEYEVGGEAKLVATGTYVLESKPGFQLDNELEIDKLYLFERYDDGIGFVSVCVGMLTGSLRIPSVIGNTNNDQIFPAELSTFGKNNIYITPIGIDVINWDDWYITENDYIKVYELPITLGGNE